MTGPTEPAVVGVSGAGDDAAGGGGRPVGAGDVHPAAALLAEEIRRHRKAAGMSHAQLAAKTGYTRQYVSLAERPRKGPPSVGLVRALDRALDADGALVTLREQVEHTRQARRRNGVGPLPSPVSTPAGLPHAQPCAGADEVSAQADRFSPGAEAPGPGSPAMVAGVTARSARSDIAPEEHAGELKRLQQVDQTEGPERAARGVAALLDEVGDRLVGTRGTDRGVLLRVAARAAEFAGFLQRDLGAEELCLYWHDRAMEFAQQANDGPMQAYVLLRKAQATYDQRNASRMLDLTLAAGRFGTALGPGLRAEILQQRARGEAMLGASVDAVRHRLDEAATVLSARDGQMPAAPGQHYSERLLGLQSALCLTEAGRPRDAVLRYREIIAPDLCRRDHAYFSILMATSLALSGEPDEAARVAYSALPVAVATASRRSVREARTLFGVLAPWRGRHHVRQLHAALRSAMGSPMGSAMGSA